MRTYLIEYYIYCGEEPPLSLSKEFSAINDDEAKKKAKEFVAEKNAEFAKNTKSVKKCELVHLILINRLAIPQKATFIF